jgi:hypothetical protein
VGAADFHDGHADHVVGIVAQGDTLTISLTAPSADFLRRLTLPYFCPLPVGTPTGARRADTTPLPAAGPGASRPAAGGAAAVPAEPELQRGPEAALVGDRVPVRLPAG